MNNTATLSRDYTVNNTNLRDSNTK